MFHQFIKHSKHAKTIKIEERLLENEKEVLCILTNKTLTNLKQPRPDLTAIDRF